MNAEAASNLSGTEWIAIISAIFTGIGILVAQVFGLIVSLRNSRKIDEVHKVANSLSDKRAELAEKSAYAQGELAANTASAVLEAVKKAAVAEAKESSQKVEVVNAPTDPVPTIPVKK